MLLKKEFKNLKDGVLKLIDNSCICDVKRKDCKKDNKEKDSDDSKNVNDNDNDDNDNKNNNNNLTDRLLNNKDKLHNFSDKVLNNLIIVAKLKENFLINIEKIRAIFNKIENISKKDIRLKLDKYKKLNILIDDLINHIWRMMYGKNRVNNEIDNIDCYKDEDSKRYTHKYINILNYKLILINAVSNSIDELMKGFDVDTSNDIVVKKLKDFKDIIIKSVDEFNSYIKLDIKKKYIEKKDIEKKDIEKKDIEKRDIKKKDIKKKDIEKKDTNNNIKHVVKINKPDNGLATSVDIKAYIIDKRKLLEQRYKSLLETKKTIKNNIELIYKALKNLPKESQPKLIELVRLDTILNDSINVIWREIYERHKKGIKKIDVNKIKNVDGFIHQLKIIINNKIILLKTYVIVKLNLILSDLKEKSGMDDVYNYNAIDKLYMIYKDLDKYMKNLKKDIGSIKKNLKMILTNQSDSHQTLMEFLK